MPDHVWSFQTHAIYSYYVNSEDIRSAVLLSGKKDIRQ